MPSADTGSRQPGPRLEVREAQWAMGIRSARVTGLWRGRGEAGGLDRAESTGSPRKGLRLDSNQSRGFRKGRGMGAVSQEAASGPRRGSAGQNVGGWGDAPARFGWRCPWAQGFD